MESSAIRTPHRPTGTGLPRPLSKLPAPRSTFVSAIPTPAPPVAESNLPYPQHKSQSSQGSDSTASTSYLSTSSISSPSRPTTGRKASNESNDGQSTARQPLYPSQRSQSQQGLNSFNAVATEDHIAQAELRAARHPSQQENAIELLDSPEGSDGSNSNPTSPVRTLKKPPRPSLSDRTVESLTMSPAANRRNSSFFNPQSPMTSPTKNGSTPAQPASGIRPPQRTSSLARPVSPMKRPNSRTAQIPTPSHRITTSSALPRSGLPSTAKPPSSATPKPTSRSTVGRPQSFYGAPTPSPSKVGANGISRPPGSRMSMIAPPKSSTPAPAQPATMARPSQRPTTRTPQLNGTLSTSRSKLGAGRPQSMIRPQSRQAASPVEEPTAASRPVTMIRPRSREAASPAEEPSAAAVKADNPSTSLRVQIAQAKAAHKKALNKLTSQSDDPSPTSYNFENSQDPFNTGLNKPQTTLAKRVDSARRDGRLNIAMLDLKEIPNDVLCMYDSSAMESSSLAWSEVVDLTSLNAADNEITVVSDEVFPDKSFEELAAEEDAKGNQFGGLGTLDLHGNKLSKMPPGLRRLERLTVLNLSRNKLDNDIFELVVQISSLQELRLAENELSQKVPDNISQLTNLQVLDLQGNKLSSIPRTIRDLINLRVLNLSKNRFADLPLGSLFSLPNLLELYAGTNALTGAFFPDTVDTIRSLQTLDVSNNSLVALSFASDMHLPSLQYINISSNRMFALPDVSSWTHLLNLLAEENSLTTLPAGFTTLKKLKHADFSRNSLRALEPGVGAMEALENLNISANPLREKKLLNMTTMQIKEDLLKRLDTTEVTN